MSNKGFVLEGYPRSFMEAVWLFGKREKETNMQEIFTEVLKQKKRQIRRIYRKKKKQFFEFKNSKKNQSSVNPNLIMKARKKKFYQKNDNEDTRRFWKMFLDEPSLDKMSKVIWETDDEDQDSESEPETGPLDADEPELTDMDKFFEDDAVDVDTLRADLERLAADEEAAHYELGKYE